MESATLLSGPAFLIALGLIVVSAWIGHAIGRSNENKRKELALAEADTAAKAALHSLGEENQKKLDVLNKANTNDMQALKQSHTQQVDQLNLAHQALVDSLKSGYSSELERLEREHSGLIDRLNSSNNANISELEQRRQSEIEQLRVEHKTTVDALRREQSEALAQVKEDRDQRLREAEQRAQQEKTQLNALLAEVRGERDAVKAKAAELDATITTLRDEMKEAKMNNMFSVSKSGEKLIRVVRSVQELASELDETSRAVTGGDYSFFDQIKDQRDRETVLSLTAGRADFTHEPADDGGSADDGAPAEDADGADAAEDETRG